MMHKSSVLAVVLLVAQSALAAVTLPFHEPFPLTYTEGERLGGTTSGVIWEAGNSTGVGSATNTIAAALCYSGLTNSSASRGILLLGTPNSNRDRGVIFNPAQVMDAANPRLYVSFLLNVQSAPSTPRRLAYFRNSTSAGNNNAAVFLNAANQLQIAKSATAPEAPATSALGTVTNLVVMRYRWVSAASGDDEVALWLNPGSLGVDEDSVPSPTISTTNGTDVADLKAFFISQRMEASGTLYVDEVRIATNWAAVTPPSGPVAPPSEPYIIETLMTPDGLVLRGTNGTPDGTYQVLRSTDVAAAQYEWVSIATNTFEFNGSFDCTNPISPAEVQMFYRLLAGGSLPPPPVAPSITTQPTNQTVTVGQNAVFSIVADGTAPLHYQWYFNTNTPLAANSDTLTVTNVQETNAGTYSVVITNIAGMVTSSNATLTVNPVPIAPSITTQPTNLTVAAGSPATFTVVADGTAPLRYQWFFNTNAVLLNEKNSSLTFASTHATNEGAYSVRVTNVAGSVTSAVATLTVLSPPFITTQPQNQAVTVSNNATFWVTAVGTAPLGYQWYFNTNTALTEETNTLLTILNADTNDAGGYSVVVSNSYGSTTSVVALLTVNPPVTNNAIYNLYGFGQATTGGGIIAEGSPGWVKVTNALDFAWAISNKSGTIKVIEIMNNLDLGYNEVGAAVRAFSIFREHTTPLLHPRLIESGVSKIDIQQKNGLTIFSANGAAIRHATFNIKDSANVIVRNLKFDEMWEWDESGKGDYDRNDWDFITLGDGGGTVSNVWIDHCTFTKSYDGNCDIKGGAHNITFSWNNYAGDDGATNPNSYVWQQINSLESNKTAYAMYNFLRTRGFSTTNIVTILQGHQKTHLIGATADDAYAITFHHQLYMNCWDRLPRLRGGNVHNYNIYVDDIEALAARRLRDAIAATMSAADQNTLNNTYNFKPFLNGTISTEGGAILVEKSAYIDCLWPLRNNQTDTNNPAYTGKIMALDSIYHFNNTSGPPTHYRGDSTNAPGDTLFGPVQASVIPFSWNGFTTLPYSYTMDDPSQLQAIVANPNTGAGAGVLTWARTNWLKTSY